VFRLCRKTGTTRTGKFAARVHRCGRQTPFVRRACSRCTGASPDLLFRAWAAEAHSSSCPTRPPFGERSTISIGDAERSGRRQKMGGREGERELCSTRTSIDNSKKMKSNVVSCASSFSVGRSSDLPWSSISVSRSHKAGC
jgi:hypothetical protein